MQVCCTLDDLAEQFQTRISMLKDRLTLRDMSSEPSCVLMCSSIYSMLGDVDGMLILMKSEVARRKITVDRAKELASAVADTKQRILHASANLPDRLPSKTQPPPPVVSVEPREVIQMKLPKAPTQTQKRPRRPTPPSIEYLTVSEFTNVPKYMKGRTLYDSFNSTIDELNRVFASKYKVLSTGRTAQSDNIRNKIQIYKEQETKDTIGLFFVVDADLKVFSRLKMDNAGRTHFTVLRHCGRIREIRGNGLTRYTLC